MENNEIKVKQDITKFAMVPIWLQDYCTAREIATYFALCRYIDNDTKGCYPSLNKLADDMKASRNTVKRSIDSLVAKGIVNKQIRKKEDGTNKSNYYILAFDKEDINAEPLQNMKGLGTQTGPTQPHTLAPPSPVDEPQTIPNITIPNELYDYAMEILRVVAINKPTENQKAHAFKEAKQIQEAGYTVTDIEHIAKNIGLTMGLSFVTIGNINKYSYLADGPRTATKAEVKSALEQKAIKDWADEV